MKHTPKTLLYTTSGVIFLSGPWSHADYDLQNAKVVLYLASNNETTKTLTGREVVSFLQIIGDTRRDHVVLPATHQ